MVQSNAHKSLRIGSSPLSCPRKRYAAVLSQAPLQRKNKWYNKSITMQPASVPTGRSSKCQLFCSLPTACENSNFKVTEVTAAPQPHSQPPQWLRRTKHSLEQQLQMSCCHPSPIKQLPRHLQSAHLASSSGMRNSQQGGPSKAQMLPQQAATIHPSVVQ